MILFLIIRHLLDPVNALVGWTSTVAFILLMGGLNLVAVGVVGLYVGNIFTESKNRPLYVVAEVLNREDER